MDFGQQVSDAGQAGVVPGTTNAADPWSAQPTAGDTGVALGVGAGQHGIAPLIGNGGGTVTDAINHVWDWLNTPFAKPMSPVAIFALVGSVIIAIMLWNLILYHIRIAAETI